MGTLAAGDVAHRRGLAGLQHAQPAKAASQGQLEQGRGCPASCSLGTDGQDNQLAAASLEGDRDVQDDAAVAGENLGRRARDGQGWQRYAATPSAPDWFRKRSSRCRGRSRSSR